MDKGNIRSIRILHPRVVWLGQINMCNSFLTPGYHCFLIVILPVQNTVMTVEATIYESPF